MAANLAAINNYLNNVIGIHQQPTREALNAQGIDSFASLDTLTDGDIKSICEYVRKPGGTIPNPAIEEAADVAAAAAVQPREVPNRGQPLGFVFEKRLRQLRYYKIYMHKIQRAFIANGATLARLNTVWSIYEAEKEEVDVPEPPKLLKVEDVRRVLENLDHIFALKRGVSGSPLHLKTQIRRFVLYMNTPNMMTPQLHNISTSIYDRILGAKTSKFQVNKERLNMGSG